MDEPTEATAVSYPKKRAIAKAETGKKVLSGARQWFTTHAYHQATVREIAEGIEMSTGAIYNCFVGKEQLFAAVVREECIEYEELREKLRQNSTITERELIFELLAADYRPDRLSLLQTQLSLAFGGSALIGDTLEERAVFVHSILNTREFPILWAAHLYTCRPHTTSELTPDALKRELAFSLKSIGLETQG